MSGFGGSVTLHVHSASMIGLDLHEASKGRVNDAQPLDPASRGCPAESLAVEDKDVKNRMPLGKYSLKVFTLPTSYRDFAC